jgi:bacterioferritin-associated ferredoxin
MYVCVCNAVTDRQIRRAVHRGVLTFQQLQLELAISTCCGRCEPTARRVLAEAVATELPAIPDGVQLPDAVPA